MNVEAYETLRRKQYGEIKAYAIFLIFIISSMGYYIFVNYQHFSIQKSAAAQGKVLIEKMSKNIDDEKSEYEAHKKAFENQSKDLNKKLHIVFPDKTDEKTFTKQIDLLEKEFNKAKYGRGEFYIPSISYSALQSEDNYTVLPFVLSISTSYDKLMSFLKRIEASGSLTHGEQYRLMDVQSINLTLPQDDSDTDQNTVMNFQVRINAYSQKMTTNNIEK